MGSKKVIVRLGFRNRVPIEHQRESVVKFAGHLDKISFGDTDRAFMNEVDRDVLTWERRIVGNQFSLGIKSLNLFFVKTGCQQANSGSLTIGKIEAIPLRVRTRSIMNKCRLLGISRQIGEIALYVYRCFPA